MRLAFLAAAAAPALGGPWAAWHAWPDGAWSQAVTARPAPGT